MTTIIIDAQDGHNLFSISTRVEGQRVELREMDIRDESEARRIADQYAAKIEGQSIVEFNG